MRLKTYRADTIAAALALMRAELGSEALILGSRRVQGGVELTAALEAAAPPPARLPDPARLAALRWHGVPEPLAAILAQDELTKSLQARLRFAPLALQPAAPPLLLAGPPGAGKTLTTARLATRLVLQGTTPMVICADGDRAGAPEQLAAFTRLLGLVLIVAPDPITLARSLARRQSSQPVLIDTAGIDPFCPASQAALAALAAAAGAATALVLPAGLDAGEAFDAAAAFSAAGATSLIVTRLDVTRRRGAILAAAAHLPLAEAGTGPGAADGLQPMTPALLATLLDHPTHRTTASKAA